MDKVTETREQRLAGIRERAEAYWPEWASTNGIQPVEGWLLLPETTRKFAAAFADSERERVLLEAARAVQTFQCSELESRKDVRPLIKKIVAAIHDLRSKRESQ